MSIETTLTWKPGGGHDYGDLEDGEIYLFATRVQTEHTGVWLDFYVVSVTCDNEGVFFFDAETGDDWESRQWSDVAWYAKTSDIELPVKGTE